MKTKILGVLLAGMLAAPVALATTVSLNGGTFLQSGSFTNASGLVATSFTYSLGAPGDGVATWDTSTGGGTASNFLTNAQYFQTVTWSGLNVANGGTYNFAGLDIDLILTLTPLDVSGAPIDEVGTSLRNAFVSVGYANGSSCRASLNQTGWRVNQSLNCGASTAVPEPATLGLLGAALAGLGFVRRRRG